VEEEFFQRFDVAFEKMKPEEKWTLSSGKIVEDELFKTREESVLLRGD
jgi:hypothetical protein